LARRAHKPLMRPAVASRWVDEELAVTTLHTCGTKGLQSGLADAGPLGG
jgi:hypothetical protein